MRSHSVGVLCASLGCSVAAAQFTGGVNIDLNAATGLGAGQPTILFTGGASAVCGIGPFGAGRYEMCTHAVAPDGVTFITAPGRALGGRRADGLAGRDGLFDNNDFIAFIDMFFGECL